MKKIVLLLALSVLPISGCTASAIIIPAASMVTTGVVTWKRGEATKYYEYETHIIRRATLRALNELQIPINSQTERSIRAGNGDRFNIKIQPATSEITRLSIRVNFMGDREYAELIYRHVDDAVNVIEFN